ncbi:MAG: DNA repair protein RecN [Candidatus Latescibacterota bacterium]|nr:DNA repair protein RecN [Candidatus Latescibacterota bacterium]
MASESKSLPGGLRRLRIDSFALIESVDIELGSGLTVITGETGAGKSILIGALHSILGASVSTELVRRGADRCRVEGLFEIDPNSTTAGRLAESGVELDDEGHLLLCREIRVEGRSRAFINGEMVPVRRLREAGRLLVDLHGQHEHQSLLNPDSHARFLDECGGLTKQADAVSNAFDMLEQARSTRTQLRAESRRLAEEAELRQFQFAEIEALAPLANEDEQLEADIRRLENQTTLVETAGTLQASLYTDENSIIDRLGTARRKLEALSEIDESLGSHLESLNELVYGVEDLAGQLRHYADQLEADPERLERSRERLQELRRVMRKYETDLAGVLARAESMAAVTERGQDLEREMATAEQHEADALAAFHTACTDLSKGRKGASATLSQQVGDGLRTLGMEHAEFAIHMERQEDPDGLYEQNGRRYTADSSGVEQVEFHVSANRGEAPLPLARVASGGELSRVMLILKEIIAERDAVSTVVFDEIDTGISGRVAAAVGRKLGALAKTRQTLVITHLPQIASVGEHHLSVRKSDRDDRTVTEVTSLDADARAEEIASLLAGDTVSEAARLQAQEMLR